MWSGWHSALVRSHPDDIWPGAVSSGWHRVQLTLCHPDDLRKLWMSSGWHNTLTISQPDEILPITKSSRWLRLQISLCHPDNIGHLIISHPDEVLPIAKSSGRLREQLSFICHPEDLLHRQWVYWLIYMVLGLAGTLDPDYGPFVRKSLWDWHCFVVRLKKMLINQSRRRWVQKLWRSRDVTVIS